MNVVLNESMIFFLGTNFTLISIFIVLTLALSTLCLIHMVYQELKYNRLICTNEKGDKRYQWIQDEGIDFDECDIIEYEVEEKPC